MMNAFEDKTPTVKIEIETEDCNAYGLSIKDPHTLRGDTQSNNVFIDTDPAFVQLHDTFPVAQSKFIGSFAPTSSSVAVGNITMIKKEQVGQADECTLQMECKEEDINRNNKIKEEPKDDDNLKGFNKTRKKSRGGTMCAAINCKKYQCQVPKISFFRFPKETKRCKQWVINSRRADLDKKSLINLHKQHSLCSQHFEDSQFMHVPSKKKLVWNAVPTLFNVPNPPKLIGSQRKPPAKRIIKPPPPPCPRSHTPPPPPLIPPTLELSYLSPSTPNKQKRGPTEEELHLLKAIKALRVKVSRLKKKVATFNQSINPPKQYEIVGMINKGEVTANLDSLNTFHAVGAIQQEYIVTSADGGTNPKTVDEEKLRITHGKHVILSNCTNITTRIEANALGNLPAVMPISSSCPSNQATTKAGESDITKQHIVQETVSPQTVPFTTLASQSPSGKNERIVTDVKELEDEILKNPNAPLLQKYQIKHKRLEHQIAELKQIADKIDGPVKKTKKNAVLKQQLESQFSGPGVHFALAQIKNRERRTVGRRWNIEDKKFAANLMKSNIKTYRMLRKKACLPSIPSLRRHLRAEKRRNGITNCTNIEKSTST